MAKARAKKTTKAKAKPKASRAKAAAKAKPKATRAKAAAKARTTKAKAPAKASGPMTKAAIVDHLASRLGTTKKTSAAFLDELAQLVYKNAKKQFTIPGLGKVFTTRTKKRKGRNPATGQEIVIPAKNKVKFRVAKALQDAVYPSKK